MVPSGSFKHTKHNNVAIDTTLFYSKYKVKATETVSVPVPVPVPGVRGEKRIGAPSPLPSFLCYIFEIPAAISFISVPSTVCVVKGCTCAQPQNLSAQTVFELLSLSLCLIKEQR